MLSIANELKVGVLARTKAACSSAVVEIGVRKSSEWWWTWIVVGLPALSVRAARRPD
jgi:hypothetical protein